MEPERDADTKYRADQTKKAKEQAPHFVFGFGVPEGLEDVQELVAFYHEFESADVTFERLDEGRFLGIHIVLLYVLLHTFLVDMLHGTSA